MGVYLEWWLVCLLLVIEERETYGGEEGDDAEYVQDDEGVEEPAAHELEGEDEQTVRGDQTYQPGERYRLRDLLGECTSNRPFVNCMRGQLNRNRCPFTL